MLSVEAVAINIQEVKDDRALLEFIVRNYTKIISDNEWQKRVRISMNKRGLKTFKEFGTTLSCFMVYLIKKGGV